MSYVSNINNVFKQVSATELQDGLAWYSDAFLECQTMADTYELPVRIVAGVVAALSPTNRWSRNLIDADNMLRIFCNGGYVESCKPCTYKPMRDKAWKVLTDMPATVEAVAAILKGPKITDFYLCSLGKDVCVIDGHAWCIANNDRRTMQEVPNIGKKLRAELQAAYSKAGKQHKMTAYQMQAATWVAWRRIHNV